MINSGGDRIKSTIMQQPGFDKGRSRPQAALKTAQIVPYSRLDQRQMLKKMLRKAKGQRLNLN